MVTVISKLIGEKKEWKAMEARVAALPLDYPAVYDEIKAYLWKVSSGDGLATIAVLRSVIVQFEAGAALGRGVRDVVGSDVAAFCDAQMESHGAPSYVDAWRAALNAGVDRKLAE